MMIRVTTHTQIRRLLLILSISSITTLMLIAGTLALHTPGFALSSFAHAMAGRTLFSSTCQSHGMRNEIHMLLKWLRRTVQCSCSFWGGAKNTSAFWKTGELERMLSSSIAADLKESRKE